jgi:hypothetical protein
MNTTLATPYALGLLLGVVLIYFSLRGFDQKHNLFGGKLAGIGSGGVPGASTGQSGPPSSTGGTA